jgi:hypothetical protein
MDMIVVTFDIFTSFPRSARGAVDRTNSLGDANLLFGAGPRRTGMLFHNWVWVT